MSDEPKTLEEFLKCDDPNMYWRLSSGAIQNFLDEAIDKIADLEAENAVLKARLAEYSYDVQRGLCAEPCCADVEKIIAENKELREAIKEAERIMAGGCEMIADVIEERNVLQEKLSATEAREKELREKLENRIDYPAIVASLESTVNNLRERLQSAEARTKGASND